MILALTLAAVLGVTGLEGEPIDPFVTDAAKPPRALVFVFVDPNCPVSNRYVPELNRLHDAYRQHGVAMWVVYSGAVPARDGIRAHYATYGLRVPALVDRRFMLADRAGATMTGEAAVYVARARTQRAAWGLVYRGRIDDRARRQGVWRATPTVRDLADVLQRLDDGEELTYRTTQAIGCYLKPLS